MGTYLISRKGRMDGGGGGMTPLTNYEKAIIWKECEQLFSIQHKNTSKI